VSTPRELNLNPKTKLRGDIARLGGGQDVGAIVQDVGAVVLQAGLSCFPAAPTCV
jgi:hypothetical protein